MVFILLAFAIPAYSDFYVSPSGDDSAPGAEQAPFASLERARDAVRALRQSGLPDGGVTVWISGGDYYLKQSFSLTSEDSGEEGKPVIYRAAPGMRPRLVGGVRLAPESFQPITDAAVKGRIDPAVRDAVLCANVELSPDSVAYPDGFEAPPVVPELFLNDERMTLARWPDNEWAEIGEIIDGGPAPWRDFTASQGAGTFKYDGDRPARWLNAPGVWLHGYWCFDWACETIRVKSIDAEKHLITLSKPHVYGIGSGNPPPRRFYAVNLLEELDRPGEYYLDPAGKLYFLPPGELAGARIMLSALRSPLIDVKDASHVMMRGLLLEDCAKSAIEIRGGADVTVAGCIVRNTGKDAILLEGGERHRVVSCDVYDIGTAGIVVSGGDRKTLHPCNHEVLNNHVYRVSRRQRTHAFHIHVGGVGVRVANNLLHDGPHQAIGLGGNDHIIEYNEIHRISMETDDCGAFYMGRNPSERGSIIRYNYWHDIGSKLSHGSCAIYFDDGAGGQTVLGNIFARACGGNFGAVFVHGGHDNLVENNIFIECGKAMAQVRWDDDRWAKFLVEYRDRMVGEVDITKTPYIDRYPDLKDYLEPQNRPRFNTARYNIAYKCGKLSEGDWNLSDNFFGETDPGFVDAAAGDYRLRPDSPVLRDIPRFKPIPIDKIGLYKDEFRLED